MAIQCDSGSVVRLVFQANLHGHTTGIWELQEVVAEVFHPVDVDPDIGGPVEGLDQRPGTIVYAQPRNDLQEGIRFQDLQLRNRMRWRKGSIEYAMSMDRQTDWYYKPIVGAEQWLNYRENYLALLA